MKRPSIRGSKHIWNIVTIFILIVIFAFAMRPYVGGVQREIAFESAYFLEEEDILKLPWYHTKAMSLTNPFVYGSPANVSLSFEQERNCYMIQAIDKRGRELIKDYFDKHQKAYGHIPDNAATQANHALPFIKQSGIDAELFIQNSHHRKENYMHMIASHHYRCVYIDRFVILR